MNNYFRLIYTTIILITFPAPLLATIANVNNNLDEPHARLSVNEQQKLNKHSQVPVEYSVEFAQFTPEQVAQFYAFYTQYSGYIDHQLQNQNLSTTTILYSTQANKSALLNNFQKTAEHLGLQVLIRSAHAKISLQFMGVTVRNLPYKEWEE